MFLIQVKDAILDQIIGHITTQELQKFMGSSKTEFVPETVKRFNEMKENRGEPERVKMVFK
jgi:hypothetical protein